MIYISFHIWSLRTSKCSLIFIKIRRMDCISLMKQSKLIINGTVFESRRYPSSTHSSWLVELQDMVCKMHALQMLSYIPSRSIIVPLIVLVTWGFIVIILLTGSILLVIFKSFQSGIGSISLAASSLFYCLAHFPVLVLDLASVQRIPVNYC